MSIVHLHNVDLSRTELIQYSGNTTVTEAIYSRPAAHSPTSGEYMFALVIGEPFSLVALRQSAGGSSVIVSCERY